MKTKFPYLALTATFVGTLSLATGQVKPTDPKPANASGSEVVKLSVFEVSGKKGTGYSSSETTTGFKTGMPIMDLPIGVQVINREMFDDVSNIREGVVATVRYGSPGMIPYDNTFDTAIVRGTRAAGFLVDDGVEPVTTFENVDIERVDVLKGPAAVTYPSTSLAGIVNTITKKPLGIRQRTVTVSSGSSGYYRGELDFTGPLVSNKNGRLTYRFTAALKKDPGFLKPYDTDDRLSFTPSLQYNFNQTMIRAQLVYYNQDRIGYSGSFLKVDRTGNAIGPWDGAGKHTIFRGAFDKPTKIELRKLRVTAIQRLNNNWEARLHVVGNHYYAPSDEVRFNGNPDQATGTARMYNLDIDQTTETWHAASDVNGKYSLFGVDQVTTFGINHTESNIYAVLDRADLPTISLFKSLAEQGFPIVKPPKSAFTDLAPPTKTYTQFSNFYYMHTASVWKNKVIAVAGISYALINSTETLNLRTRAWTVSLPVAAYPYRLGFVFKPINGVSLFANNATTFSIQTQRNIRGELIGNREGEVVEYGVKLNLLGGRITGTLIRYDLDETNLAVLDPASFGAGIFYIPIGKQLNSGWEADLTLQPVPNWSAVLTYFKGDIVGVTGTRVANTIDRSASILSKYVFTEGGLKGFSLGGNWFYSGRRWHPLSGGNGWPAWDVFNAFLSYDQKGWGLSLHIDNVIDKYYSDGGFLPLQWSTIAPPRNARLSFRKSF